MDWPVRRTALRRDLLRTVAASGAARVAMMSTDRPRCVIVRGQGGSLRIRWRETILALVISCCSFASLFWRAV